MVTKEKIKIKALYPFIFFFILVFLIIFYIIRIQNREIYAIKEEEKAAEEVKISNAKKLEINDILNEELLKKPGRIEIYEKNEELEYITKYRNNSDLDSGTTKISQEGKNGIQTITFKKIFDADDNLINEEQVNCRVTKSSIDKIIEVGSKKRITGNITSVNSKMLSFNMALNEPSGFTLEQFKIALTDNRDKNKIFEKNSEYFYYIEKQYNINGIFVAALGIHESAWGTSKIAKDKFNLFGYGAYDSNPYNGAYSFKTYSECIDLIARVLVKYYLNPAGSIIYDGQKAQGSYYNGNTLSGVNKKYATDKNWANAIFNHMKYLYGKVDVK